MSNNNTGHRNSGGYNSGGYNSGDFNSGDFNSGDFNSGDYNSGDLNSGDYNSGGFNSGDRNSGDYNSGGFNSGHRNSGGYNSGHRNSGGFNSGDFNSGWFNTNEPKMRFFNKDSKYTYSKFVEKFNVVYPDLHICQWIVWSEMSEEERRENPKAKETDGYLKTMDYKEAWREYWSRAIESDKQFFLNLPNFDAGIFKEITGIDVNKPEQIIEIEGVKYTLAKIKKALKEQT